MWQPVIPWSDIRDLPLPDLALVLLRRQATRNGDISLNNVLRGLDQALASEPQADGDALLARVADAWTWLESHALIGSSHRNTNSGWQRVTATGLELAEDPHAVTKVWADDRLAGELNPLLASARSNFALGDYETASFAAMKAVEVRVREATGLPNDLTGVKLMRKAFAPNDGILTDSNAEGGEQQATADLFAGAMGTFKNPASHRTVQFDDAVEAAEVVQLADLLLRIVARAEARPV